MPRLLLGQSLAWAGAAVSFALALVNPYFLNMFWQIPDGEAILAGHLPSTVDYAIASGPLVPQEWLYEAGMAWFVHHHAYGAFVLLCAVAAATTPLLAYAVARRFGAGDIAAGIAAFLTVGARFAGSAVRPETFAVDAFALELLLLAGMRGVWTVVPVVVLWANIHASVVLAPVAAFLFALGTALASGRFDARARHAASAAALIALATLATPSGIRLWSYAFALAVAPNVAREHLDAWRPLSFGFAGSVTAVLPGLLLLLVLGPVLRRRTAAEALIAAFSFGLTLTHARYATFLAVGWAPLLARTLDERTPLAALAQRRPAAPLLALLPLAVYAAWAVPATLRIPAEPRGAWTAAAAIVREHRLHGNAYATYIWAAYLHWQRLPLRLLIDAHGDPYPRDVWEDHLALEGARPNWADVLDRRKIDVVIVPSDTALAQVMLLAPAWRTAGTQDGVIAFARR